MLGLCGVTGQAAGPEPAGWYCGDMHVHRDCGGSPTNVTSLYNDMVSQDMAVVSLLADMGNGEVQNPTTDLPLVNGKDASVSTPGRIVHWDTEWHWDADYTQYPHQALGGHIVALGLTNAYQIWCEPTYPIFDWAHQQGGIGGFAHFEYLDDSFPTNLTCCTPIEYPVEVALGDCDFISEDVGGSDYLHSRVLPAAQLRLSARLCGRFRLAVRTARWRCYPAIGPLLTYSQVAGGQLTYSNWIHAIALGRTMVTRNGRNEFVSLVVNGMATPGDEIQLSAAGSVPVTVTWTAQTSLTGTLELVCNGVVVASQAGHGRAGLAGDVEHRSEFPSQRVAVRAADGPHARAPGAHGGGVCDGERRAGAGERRRCAVLCAMDGEHVDEHVARWDMEFLLPDHPGDGAGALPDGAEHVSADRHRSGRRSGAAWRTHRQLERRGVYRFPLWKRAWINASRFQAVSNAAVSTVYAQVGTIAGHYKCAIYADAGGSPSAFLRGTAEVSNPTDGWQAFPLTSSFTLTNGSYYWLAIWSDDANAGVYYSDNGGTLRWGQYQLWHMAKPDRHDWR